jgi:hypothetical protein
VLAHSQEATSTASRLPAHQPSCLAASPSSFLPPTPSAAPLAMMSATHASHCPRCRDPFHIYVNGDALRDRGHAYGGFSRGPSALERRCISVPASARASALSHIGFSHGRGVLRPLFRTLHSPVGHQRSSACFRPVCLSLFCRSDWLANPIACASLLRLAYPLL